MPYLNEHAARLLDPDLFDPDTFRRTHGSGEGRVQGVKIPDTIDVIWGKLKEKNKPSDPVVAQALRFPIEHWTFEETKNWLEKNGIKYIELVKAKGNKKNIEMEKEIRSFESDCAIEEREIDGVNKKSFETTLSINTSFRGFINNLFTAHHSRYSISEASLPSK